MLRPATVLTALLSSTTLAIGQVPARLAIPDALGINVHFTDNAQPGELDLLAATGARWIRADMDWAASEKQRGVYDFGPWERLLDQCRAKNLRVLMVLAYANPLYDAGQSPHTDQGRAAFAAWAAAAVKRLHGRGVLWECYNEPNNVFWRPAPDVNAYIKLALDVGRAIKAVDPHELYVGPALSGTDGAWLEPCYKSGLLDLWDAVTVHPYGNAPPEERERHWHGVKALLDRYRPKGKPLPVLAGEWGYSSTAMSEGQQGQMLARMMLVDLAMGVPLTIWYDWRDDGPDPANVENRFGLVRNPYHPGHDPVLAPKPAYQEFKRLTTEFAGYEFDKRLDVGRSEDWVLLFKKADARKLAAWTAGSAHPVTAMGRQLDLGPGVKYVEMGDAKP